MSSLVVALGGNALVASEDHASIADQAAAVRRFAAGLIDLAEMTSSIVITHGNGPQVGYILRRSELALDEVAPVPIDYAVGDTQGAIGHMFLLALRSELSARRIDRQVVALATQVLVSADDPALASPNKPIGAVFDEATARRHASRFGWMITEDVGHGWRRAVPSPAPLAVLELPTIRSLAVNGAIVVACGGGGIAVTDDGTGRLVGLEAVIDKDRTSSLLASSLNAHTLLISTSVPAVAVDFGRPTQRWLSSVSAVEARRLIDAGEFDGGGMRPKMTALVDFVCARSDGDTRRSGIVTSTERLVDAYTGESGTRIVP